MTALSLSCRVCETDHPLGATGSCSRCFGPLDPVYDWDRVRDEFTPERIAEGPSSLWRYAPLLPVEPPVEPIPELLRAYRAREPWCEGRLIITPHSAFFTPEAWDDTRRLAAETMRAAMVGPRPQNVITPEMF